MHEHTGCVLFKSFYFIIAINVCVEAIDSSEIKHIHSYHLKAEHFALLVLSFFNVFTFFLK